MDSFNMIVESITMFTWIELLWLSVGLVGAQAITVAGVVYVLFPCFRFIRRVSEAVRRVL